ncbi:MAG: hypothetical protein NVSMB56_12860 [Pyrinomonadaceae bacterium]
MSGDFDNKEDESDALPADAATNANDLTTIERRMFRVMTGAVVLAGAFSAGFFAWRVTFGLAIGGILALLNYYWLSSSIAAIFSMAETKGIKPKLKPAKFILRYFIVALIIAAAHFLHVASLNAMLIGLSAFAVAGVVEGFIQVYFAIVHREEI